MPDDEIRELRAAVRNLGARVEKLEQLLALRSNSISTASTESPQAAGERFESRVGLTLVNRIGAITLAIGIIFFFKYAVDSQWINASGRVLLGLAGGLALIGAAEWLWRRNQRVFAQGICGCGLASVFISLYAAHAYYHLLSRPADLAAIFVSCGLAILLGGRYQSSALATLGLVVSFIATALFNDADDGRLIYFVLLLLLSLASVYVAVRRQSLVLLQMTAPVAWICAWILLHASTSGWLLLFYFALSGTYFGASRIAPAGSVANGHYVFGHIALLIAIFRALHLWALSNIAPANQVSFISETISVLLAVYAVLLIVVGVVRRAPIDRVIGLSAIALVIAKLYLYDVWLLQRFYRISAFVALGVLLLTASYIYSRFKDKLDAIWTTGK